MSNKQRFSAIFSLLLLVLILSGCAGSVKNMQPVSADEVITAPDAGKSMVVFMRPSGFGFAIQSSVFEINDDKPILAGIVAAKKKVAYQLEPGKHLFMVVSESADFMSAELEAGKTYYALVTPRMGVWKARFSLKPITADELGSSQFNEWLESCEWVELSPASHAWVNTNIDSIQSKQIEYYADWMDKDISERPQLLPGDGK